jgi:hypothetical protein
MLEEAIKLKTLLVLDHAPKAHADSQNNALSLVLGILFMMRFDFRFWPGNANPEQVNLQTPA